MERPGYPLHWLTIAAPFASALVRGFAGLRDVPLGQRTSQGIGTERVTHRFRRIRPDSRSALSCAVVGSGSSSMITCQSRFRPRQDHDEPLGPLIQLDVPATLQRGSSTSDRPSLCVSKSIAKDVGRDLRDRTGSLIINNTGREGREA